MNELGIQWTVEKRKVSELQNWAENPRTISVSEYNDLKQKLISRGMHATLVVDTDMTVLSGNQRKRVLEELGIDEVFVMIPDHKLTDDERKLVGLEDNIHNGVFDLTGLLGFESGLLKDAGFKSDFMDKLYKGVDDDEDDFDQDEALKNIEKAGPKAKHGDIYQLGRHRIMCGDSCNPDEVKTLMDGFKTDMVFTDPPYNVAYEGGGNYADTGQPKREMIKNDKMSADSFSRFLNDCIKNMLEHCDGVFYICMSSKELASLKDAFENNGGHWQSFIIWVKNTFTLSRSDWQNQYEPILYGWKATTINHYFVGHRNEGNVWENLETLKPKYDADKDVTTINVGEYHLQIEGKPMGQVCKKNESVDIWREKKPTKSTEHPTMKPIKLVVKALKSSSQRGGSVMDLFLGSGSTLIAAEQTDRICYGMELDPKYVDVIIKRWQDLTGQQSVKLN